MKIFNKKIVINIGDTDATGVIYFPRLFEKCVIILEDFLSTFHLQKYVLTKKFLFPCVHAEADFLEPIFPYDSLESSMEVIKLGTTSVTFSYLFKNQQGQLVAKAQATHVCIDGLTKQKTELPELFKASFA